MLLAMTLRPAGLCVSRLLSRGWRGVEKRLCVAPTPQDAFRRRDMGQISAPDG